MDGLGSAGGEAWGEESAVFQGKYCYRSHHVVLDVNRSSLRIFLKCLVVTAIIAESDTALNGSGPNALSCCGGGGQRTWGVHASQEMDSIIKLLLRR